MRESRPEAKAPIPTIGNAKQTRTFLDSQRGDRLFPLWRLAIATGLRRGELCGLRWRHIDLDAAELKVEETVVVVGYKVVKSTPKTDESRRTIGLDEVTVAALRQHRKRQTEDLPGFGVKRTNETRFFTREDGTPYHPQRLTAMLAARAKAAKLPVVKLHALRHGHATLGLEEGVPMKVMQERLGHSSIAVTSDIYSHVTAATDHAAAAQIATALDA